MKDIYIIEDAGDDYRSVSTALKEYGFTICSDEHFNWYETNCDVSFKTQYTHLYDDIWKKRSQIGLFILDLSLYSSANNKDGVEVAEEIRKIPELVKTPIVVYTRFEIPDLELHLDRIHNYCVHIEKKRFRNKSDTATLAIICYNLITCSEMFGSYKIDFQHADDEFGAFCDKFMEKHLDIYVQKVAGFFSNSIYKYKLLILDNPENADLVITNFLNELGTSGNSSYKKLKHILEEKNGKSILIRSLAELNITEFHNFLKRKCIQNNIDSEGYKIIADKVVLDLIKEKQLIHFI